MARDVAEVVDQDPLSCFLSLPFQRISSMSVILHRTRSWELRREAQDRNSHTILGYSVGVRAWMDWSVLRIKGPWLGSLVEINVSKVGRGRSGENRQVASRSILEFPSCQVQVTPEIQRPRGTEMNG